MPHNCVCVTDSELFVLTAFGANVMIILHICWGVVYFDGWEMLHRMGFSVFNRHTIHGYFNIVLVVASHLTVSLLVSLAELYRALRRVYVYSVFTAAHCISFVVE